MDFLFVGLGGAVGAMLRYEISLLPYKGDFPLLTLITNFLGALLIGFIVGASVKNQWSAQMVLFLKVGVCGGFTTFSTFSLESFHLLDIGRPYLAGGYMALSVVLCLAGVAGGMAVARLMMA